ncbi:MAG: hypothetical protein IKZ98_00535 [Clostridia bacterium]|nr:hypothetical protein [Clostridia bacterium]
MKRKLIAITLFVIMIVTIACTASAAHTHKYTWRVKIAATCTADGLKELKCDCGAVKETRPIPASHNWVMLSGYPKTVTTNYTFWVPSCGGHPWNHYHWKAETRTEYRYQCSKCHQYRSDFSNPSYGPEHCQYN